MLKNAILQLDFREILKSSITRNENFDVILDPKIYYEVTKYAILCIFL